MSEAKKFTWSRRERKQSRIKGVKHTSYSTWLHGRESYNLFKKQKPNIKKAGKVSPRLYTKIVKNFYKKVGEYLVTCSDGVYVDNLGYFGVTIYADKAMHSFPFYHEIPDNDTPLINAHTDGKVYCLFFTHDKYKPISRTFLPDYSFVETVKQNFSKSLMEGKKYRYNATLFI